MSTMTQHEFGQGCLARLRIRFSILHATRFFKTQDHEGHLQFLDINGTKFSVPFANQLQWDLSYRYMQLSVYTTGSY